MFQTSVNQTPVVTMLIVQKWILVTSAHVRMVTMVTNVRKKTTVTLAMNVCMDLASMVTVPTHATVSQDSLAITCQEEDNCYPCNPCKNGGVCVDGNSSFTCSCPSGLTGIHCESEFLTVSLYKAAQFYIHSVISESLCGFFPKNPVCSQQSDETWSSPPSWSGPDAALYRSFDDSDGLVLREGFTMINIIPFVSGKVRNQNYQLLTTNKYAIKTKI